MNGSGEGLTGQTVHAATWRFASAVVGAVAQFAIGVVLARLLQPADFGLITLALVVFGLANGIGDLGIASAIVQRKALTDRHLRAAFTLSVAFGLALSALFAVAAPLGSLALNGKPRLNENGQVAKAYEVYRC